MIFNPQKYKIEDLPGKPFIDPGEIRSYLHGVRPSLDEVREVIGRSMAGERLSLGDAALLVRAVSAPIGVDEAAARDAAARDAVADGTREAAVGDVAGVVAATAAKVEEEGAAAAAAEILSAARELKRRVYGNRIVLFAPLYIGNRCVNNCRYCGFRKDNKLAVRRTLTGDEIKAEVAVLERAGHKRLILVYGEHPSYDADYIARTVRLTYGVKNGSGEIRRVNINAAPLSVEGFRTVREAGIGTYQIFQETYDPERYAANHPSGPKSDYDFRLMAMDRAMEAGIDDVGLGVLLGLGDWRFELLSLVRHANHLEACYGVGPHTISFPRIKAASDVDTVTFEGGITDEDFIRMVAILRLAVPYAGLILTARETPGLRDGLIEYGISQIDAGTHLELGGYSAALPVAGSAGVSAVAAASQLAGEDINREQFALGDSRSLAEVIDSLVRGGQIPSFCTACYRKGRTGEHFMEFSTKGHIKRFCTPNALLTFAEYLEDHAPEGSKAAGWEMIRKELRTIACGEGAELLPDVESRLERIRDGKRDMLY